MSHVQPPVSSDPHIGYQVDAGVFVLTLQRPEKKNAITRTMYRALGDGLRLADSDPAVKSILLQGSDDCFTSGNDINDFLLGNDTQEERPSVYFMRTLSTTAKPIVAAVGGMAIGIGTTALLHCDLVYAGENCFLQLPFTRLGLCPEAGSSLLLAEVMGHQRAAELLLLGERFMAQQAHAWGLVNAVLPDDDVRRVALEKAQALAALPADAVQTSKRLLKRRGEKRLPDTINAELAEFARLLQGEEAQAIARAFLSRKG